MIRLCYLDESGTPEIPGTTSHFVLLGLSIPGASWKAKESQVASVKTRFNLTDTEIHT
ncbi:MAG: DUF3800 domain-containing protein, partial [bacterium]